MVAFSISRCGSLLMDVLDDADSMRNSLSSSPGTRILDGRD